MNWLNDVSNELAVPKVNVVCLSAVLPSKKNNKSVTFVFRCVDDIENSTDDFESVLWTYTQGAKLNPTDVMVNGEKKRMAISLGGIQLMSLLSAFDVEDEDLREWLDYDRDTLAYECEKFVGLCVECPMTGAIKGNDKITRVGFNFPKLDFDTPEDFTDSLDEHRHCFSPSDLDLTIHMKGARSRVTRPDNAVVPVGAEEGDSIL